MTSKEIEALYARPTYKQNQIGIPVNNTLDKSKHTMDQSEKPSIQMNDTKLETMDQKDISIQVS